MTTHSTAPGAHDIFCSDIRLPETYSGALVRSPVRRGYLLDVIPPKTPDEYRFFSAIDIPGKNSVSGSDIAIFSPYKITYAGEPVGIIIGPSPKLAKEFAAATKVIAEPAPPITFSADGSPRERLSKRAVVCGNTQAAFDDPATAFCLERSYRVPRQYTYSGEPNGVIAQYDGKRLTIYSQTRWAAHLKRTVAAALEISEQIIDVVAVNPGEAAEERMWFPSLLAAQAALAAFLTRKTVRLFLSRDEDFLYAPQAPAAEIRHRCAVRADGKVIGAEVRVFIDAGTGNPLIHEITDRMAIAALGLYEIPAYSIEVSSFCSNNPPTNARKSWGEEEMFFAIETHMSACADLAASPPAQFKLMNVFEKSRKFITGGESRERIPLVDLCAEVAALSDFSRKQTAYAYLNKRRSGLRDGPLKGVALSVACQDNGLLALLDYQQTSAAEAVLSKDGTLTLRTSSWSANMIGIWKKLCADILGINSENVKIEQKPNSNGAFGANSANVSIMCRLVERCCTAISKLRFRSPLPIEVKRVYKPSANRAWDAERFSGVPYVNTSWGAAVVEVEIDPDSYATRIKGIWMCVDAGKIFSRDAAIRALRKSARDALSKTVVERVVPVADAVGFNSIYQYDTLDSADYPEPVISLRESNLEPRGIGCLAMNLIPSAYTAAVNQALVRPICALPARAEDIYAGLEEL